MGFLNDIRKTLFGAKAATRSMRESARETGDDIVEKARQVLEDDDKDINFEEEAKEKQNPKVKDSSPDIDYDFLKEEPDSEEPEKAPKNKVEEEDDLSSLFDDEEDIFEKKTTRSSGKKRESETSERAEHLRRQAEELGDEILRKGGEAFEGAKTMAGKIFEKAGDLVEKAQKEAAEELDKKLEAARKLEEKLEKEKREYDDPKKSIFDEEEDLLSQHDDFFERAQRYADGDYQNEGKKQGSKSMDIKRDPDFKRKDREGIVPGFEDLDGDGDEIIDDAIIDDDPPAKK